MLLKCPKRLLLVIIIELSLLSVSTGNAQEHSSESSDYSRVLPRGFDFKGVKWGG